MKDIELNLWGAQYPHSDKCPKSDKYLNKYQRKMHTPHFSEDQKSFWTSDFFMNSGWHKGTKMKLKDWCWVMLMWTQSNLKERVLPLPQLSPWDKKAPFDILNLWERKCWQGSEKKHFQKNNAGVYQVFHFWTSMPLWSIYMHTWIFFFFFLNTGNISL